MKIIDIFKNKNIKSILTLIGFVIFYTGVIITLIHSIELILEDNVLLQIVGYWFIFLLSIFVFILFKAYNILSKDKH